MPAGSSLPTAVPTILQNQFSPNSNNLNQTFFNAAFAGRLSANPIYKETYWCDIIGEMGLGTFLDEYTGFDTFCHPAFSNVEYDPYKDQIKITAQAASIPAYATSPNTVMILLDTSYSQFLLSSYILPQVGDTIVAPPYGALLEVVSVTPGGGAPNIVVRHRSTSGAAFSIPGASVMKVLHGKYLADCECPSGQFRVPDLPVVTNLTMKTIGTDSGELCGDALNACQNLKLPFFDSDSKMVAEYWWNEPLKRMYTDFEKTKTYVRLLDPDWGLIPVLVARGSVFTTASSLSVTVDDIYAWGTALTTAGVQCTDYAVACGRDLFVMFQQLASTLALNQTLIGIFDASDSCKWINLNWCKFSVGGLTLHVFQDNWMSNGLGLGAAGFRFRGAGIMIPLCGRSTNMKAGESETKMLTTTYFKDNLGRVWDNLQDGNGIWGPRNTFGTGCDKQEWTVKTRFTQTVHCPQAWGLINFIV